MIEKTYKKTRPTEVFCLKRITAIFLVFLLLCGCAAGQGQTEAAAAADLEEPEETEVSEPTQTETELPETEPPVTEPPETEPLLPETEPEDTTAELESAQLQAKIEAQLAPLEGRWEVAVCNRNSGVEVCCNDGPTVAASLIKLFVAGAYFDAVLQGTVTDSYSPQVRTMLDCSDNAACNRLIDLLGMDAINEFIRREGFADTQLNRKMLEASPLENYTSPRDCVSLLSRVLDGDFVSVDASYQILEALKNQQRTAKLPAGVPYDVKTANKTGELGDTENDAAIFWTSDDIYIVCVMATELPDPAGAREEIVKLSAEIYRFFRES